MLIISWLLDLDTRAVELELKFQALAPAVDIESFWLWL